MSHPERNLKIEYIYRTKLRQQVCRGEQRSPDKPCVIRTTYVKNVCYPKQHLCFHKPCRGAAQFLLCRNPTSRPPRRFALLFIPQTLITPQRMVGANSVRPFRSPTQLREKSKPRNSPETGCRISLSLRTEISPSPYIYSG